MAGKVLIVDDDKTISQIVSKKLTELGIETLTAGNGKEGLLVALTQHPDLILLDLMMPVMDGILMLQKLREDDWGAGVEVIIITNLEDSEKHDIALGKGVSEFVLKSNWSVQELIDLIKRKLGQE